MAIDLEALKKEWAAEIAEAQFQGAAEADAWMELRTNAVALFVELEEAERVGDRKRAAPIMAALEETNRVINARNVIGLADILRTCELVRKIKEENRCSK